MDNKGYTPRFPTGYALHDQENWKIAAIDSKGVFALYLDEFFLGQTKFFTDLEDFLEKESVSKPDIKNRLSCGANILTLHEGSTFPLEQSLLEEGYDGLAALVPVIEAFYNAAQNGTLGSAAEKRPDYIMPSKGAYGSLVIDKANGRVIARSKVIYVFYFLYLDMDADLRTDWHDILHDIDSTYRLNFDLSEADYTSRLSVFEEFINEKKLDI
ncbi:TPA: hypothetical protein HA239_05425 [Candidatus Woesearchaeota archaeon]|nr:hypothetical protein QT06_C0001G1284 [archaeon GW2011_AR15]MBS3104257.1 hypothetical protein [Candidatus Woesearchaeota archaeon]HIH41822.1 hypothetical protein [Candidatus Woesearchaeota archaeon]